MAKALRLPEGTYTVIASGGPEYLTQTKEFRVGAQRFRRARGDARAMDRSLKLGW